MNGWGLFASVVVVLLWCTPGLGGLDKTYRTLLEIRGEMGNFNFDYGERQIIDRVANRKIDPETTTDDDAAMILFARALRRMQNPRFFDTPPFGPNEKK